MLDTQLGTTDRANLSLVRPGKIVNDDVKSGHSVDLVRAELAVAELLKKQLPE